MGKGEDFNSHLSFSRPFTKDGKVSDQFVPTGRNVDPRAKICLDCSTEECKKNPLNCKRYQDEWSAIKAKERRLVECHNCKHQYDCERTYLGQCTDGEEWGEEE